MHLFDLGEMELGVTECAVDVGVDRHVAEAIDPGCRPARGEGSHRPTVEAPLVGAAGVVDHDAERVDAGLVDRDGAERLPQGGYPARITQLDVVPVEVFVTILVVLVRYLPVSVEVGIRIARVIRDRAFEEVPTVRRVERCRIRVIQHERRGRARAAALGVVAHQHIVSAAAGELRVKQFNGEDRTNRRRVDLDPVQVSPSSRLGSRIDRLPALIVPGTSRRALPLDALRRIPIPHALSGVVTVDVPPEVGPAAQRGVVTEVRLRAPHRERQHVLGHRGVGDAQAVDPEHPDKEGGDFVGDRGPQLINIRHRRRIVLESDDLDDVGSTNRGVDVPVACRGSPSLRLGQAHVVCDVYHPTQRSSIGAMLDLDTIPEDPTQVDGEPGHTQEHDKEQRHDGENRSPLLAESPDPALSIACIERTGRVGGRLVGGSASIRIGAPRRTSLYGFTRCATCRWVE